MTSLLKKNIVILASVGLLVGEVRSAEPVDSPANISASGAIPDNNSNPVVLADWSDPQQTSMQRLAYLCDRIGARLGGSVELGEAITWAQSIFQSDGLDTVYLQPVQVPVWVRGDGTLRMTYPYQRDLSVLALGSSVGADGVEGSLIVVRSWEELGPHVNGKVVLFNVPMEDGEPTVYRYGAAVQYRGRGASRAAQHGALAVLVRSVTTRSLYTPHTGNMTYVEGVDKIPAASVTTEDADYLSRLVDGGGDVRVRLDLSARTLPDATSHNVIAEIKGSELPDEVVLIGAHIDSWDVGQGAHDDGAGVVHVMETMRLIKARGITPKRTIRAVLFTNEENGLRGAVAYDEVYGSEQYIAAIESDLGGGEPLSWSATGDATQMEWLRTVASPVGLPVTDGGGGADIAPLKKRGVLTISMRPDDTHYFDVHHTKADTLDKVDPESLSAGVSALARLTWELANAPSKPQ